jgi:hypothetical protein
MEAKETIKRRGDAPALLLNLQVLLPGQVAPGALLTPKSQAASRAST